MSLAFSSRRMAPYIGNGTASEFSFDFPIIKNTDLRVSVTDALGVETVLTHIDDYTVSGVQVSTGGVVTLVDDNQAWVDGDGDLISGYKLHLTGAAPLVQGTEIRNNGTYYASIHEDTFDAIVIRLQELAYKLRRAPLLSLVSEDVDLSFPDPNPGKAIIWKDDGTLENSLVDVSTLVDSTIAMEAAEAAQAAVEAIQLDIENKFALTYHTFVNSQIATALAGEQFDPALYRLIEVTAVIRRGTDRLTKKIFDLHNVNGVFEIVEDREVERSSQGTSHGLSFTLSIISGLYQLNVAADAGGNDGTITLSKKYFYITAP